MQSKNNNLRKRLTIILATLAVLIGGVVAAPSASAASTFVRNDRFLANHVPACGAIGCPYGPNYMVPDGRAFQMVCYKDGPWHNGNYNTNRWFRGVVSGIGGQVWVSSSYVFNQTSVGRC